MSGCWRLLVAFAIPLLLTAALQVQSVVAQAQPADELDAMANQLSKLYQSGKYGEALPLAERYIAAVRTRHDEKHPRFATAISRLGMLHWAEGRFAEAETLLSRALHIDLDALGPEGDAVARDLNNLGSLLQERGRFAEAEPLMRRALAIDEQIHGPDSPAVGRDCNNLGLMYLEQGRYTDAEPLLKRALRITEASQGQEHAATANRLRNLASLYRDQARYSEAESSFKRSLEITEKSLGPGHPKVADSLATLAKLYRELARYREAEALQQRALAIRERQFGTVNIRTAGSLNDIAALYQDVGRNREAEQLAVKSLAIREAALGAQHPDVAQSVYILAVIKEKLSHMSEAETLYRRALDIQLAKLGSEHPDVGRTRANLGGLYKALGQYKEAREQLESALALRERVLTPEHPSITASLLQLAELCRVEGRREEAERLFKRARALRKSGLKDVPVFFATDRKNDADSNSLAFGNELGSHIALGLAKVIVLKQQVTWRSSRPTKGSVGLSDDDENTDVGRVIMQSLEVQSHQDGIDAARRQMQTAQAFKGQLLLFVHGYNVSFDSAVRRAGQIAYDLNFDGPTFVFSWASRGSYRGYFTDRDTTDVSTEHLVDLIKDVFGRIGASKIHVIGHSMGNIIVLRSLSSFRNAHTTPPLPIGAVVTAAPDVDPVGFAVFSKNITKLGAHVTAYASSIDLATWLSGLLRYRNRVGTIGSGEPTLFPGVDLIDITNASTSLFASNHDVYASSPIVVADMGRVLMGERTPESRTTEFEKISLKNGAGAYWKLKKLGTAR
jgi:esterase/lipase superfamily enzyme/Tfp pilus assembly protein PilF